MAVLAALVQRSGEYIRKESIIDAAWSGVVVEEGNLAVQISAIRRTLAQAPGGERWVETLARRGYRFVGPVAVVEDDVAQGAADRRVHSNLPVALTSFIGRERELVEIKRLLPGKRLLTITGVGGIGKTRLALQMAAEVMDAYRDGVWLVELGSIADPALVPTSVAQALRIQEKGRTPLMQTLCAHLKSRQLLLILDNCEHLLDACATLASTVLSSAAEPTILATSREPLRVAGEQTYTLRTLSLPDPSATLEAIGRSEAVQLFVERAQRQLPEFGLGATRAAAVAELCIHLDGIPLALELAAARVRTLSVEQITGRLNDRFRLLTGGTRSALPHQQTLRATLNWSFDLLAEPERALLRRLGIFAGAFTLEAASAVASDADTDWPATIDLLQQLVARSLIMADTNDAAGRYRLLETTRAYALGKLADAAETDALQRRHAEYFRRRFEQASENRQHMSEATWRALYVCELDEVRAALEWAFGTRGDRAIGIALSGASARLWNALSLVAEGVRRLQHAIAHIAQATPEQDQARLWYALGSILGTAAPPEAAAAQRAADLYRRLGDAHRLGRSLLSLGQRWLFMGRFDEAELVLAEAYPLLDHTREPGILATYFRELGSLKMLTGYPVAARTYFEQACSLFRETGGESMALAMLLNLGDVAWALGDLDTALLRLREAVALMRRSTVLVRQMLGHGLVNIAGVQVERGELAEALVAAREGMPLCREAGNAWSHLDHLALRAARTGRLTDAGRLAGFGDSAFRARQSSRQPNEVRARARLQRLLGRKLGDDEIAHLLADGARLSEDEACRLALLA